MRARIFQQPKNAMQSGLAGTNEWLLVYPRVLPERPDPLMGWSGGGDTRSQVSIRFDTREEAIAFAERNGIAFDLRLSPPRRRKPKAYADNFKYGRIENWTH